jgi:hypothetical protein
MYLLVYFVYNMNLALKEFHVFLYAKQNYILIHIQKLKNTFESHTETRILLRPYEVCVLQLSKTEVFQFSNLMHER